MTLIHENPKTVITLKNNKIQKRYKDGYVSSKFRNPKWLEAYDGLNKFGLNVPEIYQVTEDSIFMEYIEGTSLNLLIRNWRNSYNSKFKEIARMMAKVLELLQKQFEYCEFAKNPILHTDLWGGNIIIRKDDSLCIVDPDSFELYPTKGYHSVITHFKILIDLLDTSNSNVYNLLRLASK